MAAVVYLHAAADALRQGEDAALWHVSNTISALASAAVPLFFMLSGALLLSSGSTERPGYVLRRRLPRVAAPLLAWSAVALVCLWWRDGAQTALDALRWLPSMSVITPYWFLYALIPLYLLSPALKVLCDHLTESQWRYLLGLWLVVTVGFGTLHRFVPAPWNAWFQLNEVYTVSAVGGYAGYFLLGAWLAQREKLPSAGALWAVVLADWAIIALGTWGLSAATGSYDERFKNYLGVFTALLAAALFLLFLRYGRGRESGRCLTFLSENAFGVYLSHPMALALVEGLLGPLSAGVGGQAITFLLALAGCLAGSVLVGSVPGLCFVATGRRFRAACQNSNLFSLGKGRKSD